MLDQVKVKANPIGSGHITTSATLNPLPIRRCIVCGLCLASAAIYPLAIATHPERAHFAMNCGDRRSGNTHCGIAMRMSRKARKRRLSGRVRLCFDLVLIILEVEGMRCGMCETHVNDVVRRVEGVKKVASSHAKGRTEVVAEDNVNTALIKEAIAKQGYGVGRIETQSYEKHGLFSRKR